MAPNGNPVNPFPVVELGPQVEMPGGNTFVVGGGTSTAGAAHDVHHGRQARRPRSITSRPGRVGTWTAGPKIQTIGGQEYDSTDGPGSILPDGNVLFDASACVYNTPTHFFLYNASSNTLTQVPDVPNAPNDTSYQHADAGAAERAGAVQRRQHADGGLHGRRDAEGVVEALDHVPELDERSPRAAPTPCPASSSPGWTREPPTVTTSRTTPTSPWCGSPTPPPAWSPMPGPAAGARSRSAPGTSSTTKFTLPPSTPAGKSTLVVVANGIASPPMTVKVS